MIATVELQFIEDRKVGIGIGERRFFARALLLQFLEGIILETNYYIFITNNAGLETQVSASHIVATLTTNGFWLTYGRAPYRKLYKRGDKVLFYVAGKGARYFAGNAEIAGPLAEASDDEILLANDLGLDGFNERIPLEAVHFWKEPVPIAPLIENLAFIKDKKNYGLHFRQAAARIGADDYHLILSNTIP